VCSKIPSSLFIEEIFVAKRRNLKKEKAARNRAYARQFRSSSTKGGYSSRRRGEQKPEEEQKPEDIN